MYSCIDFAQINF